MMLEALSAPALVEPAARDRVVLRTARWGRPLAGWLLLSGWIVLPLLPAIGVLLSTVLGLGLF